VSRRSPFSVVELSMQLVTVVALAAMLGIVGLQGSLAVEFVSEIRSRQHLQAVRGQLSEAAERQVEHLLATEACQARSEDAYYGHFVLRLMAGFVLFYTSRVIFKGHVTMEEMVFTLKHHWRMVDYEPFELYSIA